MNMDVGIIPWLVMTVFHLQSIYATNRMNIILFVGIVQKTKKVAILIKIKLVLIASHHQDTNVIKKIYFTEFSSRAELIEVEPCGAKL